MSLTKNAIINQIARFGFNRKDCILIVDSLIEIIKQALETGDEILISGFGKFHIREKGERKGRNPKTGQDLLIKAGKTVVFKCSNSLKRSVNRAN